MKLVTFTHKGGKPRAGALVEGDAKIVDLQTAHAAQWKQPADSLASVLAIAEGGVAALDKAYETVKGSAAKAGDAILARKDV